MFGQKLFENQELYRANAIVQKAKKEGINVAKALRDHMVGRSVAEKVLGNDYEDEPVTKKKRGNSEAIIIAWAKEHIGQTTNPNEVADAVNLSYATSNKVIGLRSDWFHKVKRGHYIVRDADAEREADKDGGR